jgi:mannose-6-phosphate isomerase-like protein (cupin superfamily)
VLNNIKATAATVGEEAMTTSDTTTTPGRSMTWPDGTVFRITRSSEDTDGAYLEMEWDLPAHGWAPGAHVHPGLTEAYEILDGSLDVQINGVWKTLQQGESAVVPRGALHTFRVGNAPAKVRNVHKPALDFEPYIRTLNATFNERGLGKGRGYARCFTPCSSCVATPSPRRLLTHSYRAHCLRSQQSPACCACDRLAPGDG